MAERLVMAGTAEYVEHYRARHAAETAEGKPAQRRAEKPKPKAKPKAEQ
jgi:hypothetical protein